MDWSYPYTGVFYLERSVYISADTSYAPHAAITPDDVLGDLLEGTVHDIDGQARYQFEQYTNFQWHTREKNRGTVAMHAVPLGVAKAYASECNWPDWLFEEKRMCHGNSSEHATISHRRRSRISDRGATSFNITRARYHRHSRDPN